jgi:hypothetical protein
MNDKLDPALEERLERAAPALGDSGADRVDVIVALRRPADEATLADLANRGLSVRAVVGDILTGSVDLTAVADVAASDDVVKIDGGGSLAPEQDADDPLTDSAVDVSESDTLDSYDE